MLDKVKEIVSQSPDSSYEEGMYARFKRIDAKWGLKFYHFEHIRDNCYDLQSMAYNIGCGPAIGEKFEITLPNGKTAYGFITECVVTLGSEQNSYGQYLFQDEMEEEDIPEYNELINKLSEIMYIHDMHGGNVGYLDDGRMVCIDFSHCAAR